MSTLRVDNIQDQSGAERRGLKTYAIICDQKASTTDGGTFTSGAWQTRDLNTEIADPDGIVSIASNQFTLSAGSYLIEAAAPAFGVNQHQLRLYNATTSTAGQVGMSVYARSTSGDVNGETAFLSVRVTITGNTAFEIQDQCKNTRATTGFGVATDWGDEIYTIVKIFKEA